MNKSIAFLDIMGWSKLIEQNKLLAIDFLHNYSNQIKFNSDYKTDRLSSFSNFIPMSDSIIITSEDFDTFCVQLSSFLYYCFEYSINLNESRRNPAIDKNKYLSAYPLLFRGGISIEDFTLYESLTIKNNIMATNLNTNIAGAGMVNAVKLENSKEKGPRIFVEKKFVSLLSEKVRANYIYEYKKDEFEILWPNFILDNEQSGNHETLALDYFLKIYLQAEKMSTYFNDDPSIQKHYSEFILLIDKSINTFCRNKNDASFILKKYESLKKDYPRE